MLNSEQATGTRPALTVQAFWLMAAKTTGFVLALALPMVLVRVFNQSQYGVYRQAFAVITTACAMLSMGVGISAFYYLPRVTAQRASVVLNVLVFNLAIGVVPLSVLLLYPRILVHLFGGPELVPYAPLIAAVILLQVFSAFLEIIATALQDVRSSTVFIVFAQLSKVVFMTSAALLLRSVAALLWAAVAQGLLQSGILLWYSRARFGAFWKAWDGRFFREQMAYALPYGLLGLLYAAQSDMHNYFVSNAFGPASFAIYAVGCMQIPLLGLLRESVGSVMISRASELQQQRKTREILLTTIRAMRKTALIYLPVFALLMVLGRPLIVFFYTRAYEPSWPIFAINLCALPVLIILTDPVVRAYPEHRYFVVRLRIVLVAAQFLILWFLTRTIGMVGVVAVLVSLGWLEQIAVALRVAFILKVRPADVRLFGGIVKIGLVSGAAAAVTWGLRNALGAAPPFAMLAVCGTFFALVFLGLMFALGLVEPEERDLLRRQFQRFRPAVPGARP
jgi:O-antigen/teichoic acid export membrane protein